jgi:hypothetical protein
MAALLSLFKKKQTPAQTLVATDGTLDVLCKLLDREYSSSSRNEIYQIVAPILEVRSLEDLSKLLKYFSDKERKVEILQSHLPSLIITMSFDALVRLVHENVDVFGRARGILEAVAPFLQNRPMSLAQIVELAKEDSHSLQLLLDSVPEVLREGDDQGKLDNIARCFLGENLMPFTKALKRLKFEEYQINQALAALAQEENHVSAFIHKHTTDGEFHAEYLRYGRKMTKDDQYTEDMTTKALRLARFSSVSSNGCNEVQEYKCSRPSNPKIRSLLQS